MGVSHSQEYKKVKLEQNGMKYCEKEGKNNSSLGIVVNVGNISVKSDRAEKVMYFLLFGPFSFYFEILFRLSNFNYQLQFQAALKRTQPDDQNESATKGDQERD